MLNSSNRYQGRIGLARQILADEGVDALIIPSADPHMSGICLNIGGAELGYLALQVRWERWLSLRHLQAYGQTVAMWVQAPIQLAGTGIEFQKCRSDSRLFTQYLADTLPAGSKVAIDGNVLSVNEHDNLKQHFWIKIFS